MKRGAKQKKEFKKILSHYGLHYGFRAPYKVIIDVSFMVACSQVGMDGIHPRHEILSTLDEKMTPITTPEVLDELKELKEWGAFKHAKTFFLMKNKDTSVRKNTMMICDDENKEFRALDNISMSVKKIIKNDNAERYMVATNNENLRRDLGNIPGVPILSVDSEFKKVIIAKTSKSTAKQVAASNTLKTAKQDISKMDKSFASHLHKDDKKSDDDTYEQTNNVASGVSNVEWKPKKKRVRGKNPLSNRKKQSKPDIR